MAETLIKTENMRLEGLHCADCAVTIEKTVAKMNGVQTVNANFSAGKLKISYDPVKVTYPDLVACVENIGYRVQGQAHKVLEKKPIWGTKAFLLTLAAGLFLGAGLLTPLIGVDATLFTILSRRMFVSTLLLATTVVLGLYNFSREAWASLKTFRLNMDFLMTLAIIGAIFIQEYIEAASLAFLFSLAELLEGYAVEKVRRSLRELMTLAPESATVKRHSKEINLPVSQVSVGEIFIVRPGEKIALDGQVLNGTSSVDQAPITGESVPVQKEVGDDVYAGSINNEGYLQVEVLRNSENTVLARIIHLVEEAETQKAQSERFIEKFAKIYTPSIVALACAVAVIPPVLFDLSFHLWFLKALTLLVIACPCALIISTPVSVVSAITNASRNGILIKGGIYLEAMGKVRVIALDKTGTLTTGKLSVSDIVPLNGKAGAEVLTIAAILEKQSNHPIAKAIRDKAGNISSVEVQDFQDKPGKGVTGILDGTRYYTGTPNLFSEKFYREHLNTVQALQAQGKTTMLVGTETEIMGMIGLSDQVRPQAKLAIDRLKRLGEKVVLLTGDNEETARSIAAAVGIEHYHANLLPADKVKRIHDLSSKYGDVAMIGDGINDAPALAAASVGIAMAAAGSDTAIETADIALMSDDLTKLPYLLTLSRNARSVIRQNTVAAITLKFFLAAGVFPGMVSLVVAVLVGDMGASLAVIGNALRLARTRSS